jgi:hypothetical protein
MLYVATAIDPLPSARDGVHGAVSAMGFPPPYIRKTEKNPQLGPHTTSRPLTRDAGPTPLHAPAGGEWEQSVGSRYREGMASTIALGALVASQRTKAHLVYCSEVVLFVGGKKKILQLWPFYFMTTLPYLKLCEYHVLRQNFNYDTSLIFSFATSALRLTLDSFFPMTFLFPYLPATHLSIPATSLLGPGMVNAYVGQKKTALMTDRRPLCTVFLHMTSSMRCDNQPQHTRTGKNTATMVAEPPSSPGTWNEWIHTI